MLSVCVRVCLCQCVCVCVSIKILIYFAAAAAKNFWQRTPKIYATKNGAKKQRQNKIKTTELKVKSIWRESWMFFIQYTVTDRARDIVRSLFLSFQIGNQLQ